MAEGLSDGGVEGGDGQNPEDFGSSDGQADNPFNVDGLSSREIYEQIAGIDAVLADEGYVFDGPPGATEIPKGLEPLTDSTASELARDEAAAQLYRPRLALQERFDQLVAVAEEINEAVPGFRFAGFEDDRTEARQRQRDFLFKEFDPEKLHELGEQLDSVYVSNSDYLDKDAIGQLLDFKSDIDDQVVTASIFSGLSERLNEMQDGDAVKTAIVGTSSEQFGAEELHSRIFGMGGQELKQAIETLDAAVKDMLPDNDENLMKLRDVIYSRYIAAAEHARSQETVMMGQEGDESFKYTEFPLDLKPLTFEQRSAEIWRGLSPEARETALEHATNMANWYNRTLGLSGEKQVATADFSIFEAETDPRNEEGDGQMLVGYTGLASKIIDAKLMGWKSLKKRDSWDFQTQHKEASDSEPGLDDLRTYQTEANLRALSRVIPDSNLPRRGRGEAWLLLAEQKSPLEQIRGRVPKAEYYLVHEIGEEGISLRNRRFVRTSGRGEGQSGDGITIFRAIRRFDAVSNR